MQRQLQRVRERATARQRLVTDTADRLRAFYSEHQRLLRQVEEVGRELHALGSPSAAAGVVEQLDRQQRQLRQLRASRVEPLSTPVERCLSSGQELVQTAASGVSTHQLQRDLDSLNDAWSRLQEKVGEPLTSLTFVSNH